MNDILTAATPLIVTVLTYAGYLARQWVKSHTAPRQYAALAGIAQSAVAAVDQLAAASAEKPSQSATAATGACDHHVRIRAESRAGRAIMGTWCRSSPACRDESC